VAVSGNYSIDYQRDTLLTMSLQLAGQLESGQSAPVEDLEMAARFMNAELATIQAEGVVLRTIERTTQSITVADGAEYTLSASTLDVEPGPNGQAGVVKPSGGTDSVVTLMSRAEYLDIPDKTVSGRPTRVYVERGSSVKLVFWPKPDATYTFTYSRVRLLSDMDSGSVTLDLVRKWMQAVTFAVASQVALAKSMPVALADYLRSEAERLKAICRADDVQRGRVRFRLAHSGRRW